ncbi:MAG: Hpt domain-containing protein, partial [Desulfobacteraceae bacterium]|nr:Hpt domain-containing protein [Desulfobacteraceae bacterium]
MKDAHREAYKEEARELLSELEAALLELEEDPGEVNTIGRVFRALHTIKGSGAMFGFDEIAAFTHELENIYDLVRNGRATVSKKLIDLTLSAGDVIRGMLEPESDDASSAEIMAATRAAAHNIVQGVIALIPADEHEQAPPREAAPQPEESSELHTYRISFRPGINIFGNGTNPILLLNEIRSLGDSTILAVLDAIPDGDDFDPEKCYTAWDIMLTTGV